MRVYIFEWTEARQEVMIDTRQGYEISVSRRGPSGMACISLPKFISYGWRTVLAIQEAVGRALAVQRIMTTRSLKVAKEEILGYWADE